MRRCVITLVAIAFCSSAVRADVTVTSTTTIEGSAPGMAGPGFTPRMVMRIKGLRARSDVEMNGHTQTSITDLAAKEIVVLSHTDKTAQVFGPGQLAAMTKPFVMPKIEASSKSTGESRAINGAQCDEYAVKMGMNLAEFSASPGMAPEAAAMLKDVRMVISGSMWVARSGPGVADFVAFQKAAADGSMAAAFGAVVPGMQSGGLESVMKALSSISGLPYVTELQLTVEGSGQMVEMLKQAGAMKIRNAVTAVSIDPIPDDQFVVPAGYKLVKQ